MQGTFHVDYRGGNYKRTRRLRIDYTTYIVDYIIKDRLRGNRASEVNY